MYRALLIVVLTLPAAACASAQAKTPIEPVSLEVPTVPPRVVETVVIDPPPAPPVEEPVQAPAPATAPKTRPAARDRAETRPEPKPEPEPDPATQQPVAPPVPPLRTGTGTGTETASTDEAKRIAEILQNARKLLDGVDTRGMSDDRLGNYESAKDSLLRAETALKASNLVLARQHATRAENIAKLLIARQVPD